MNHKFNIGDEILVDGNWYGVETMPDDDGFFFISDKWGEITECHTMRVEEVLRVAPSIVVIDFDNEGHPIDNDEVNWGF